jgi:uncharacterized protein YecT (DUF1311 family)
MGMYSAAMAGKWTGRGIRCVQLGAVLCLAAALNAAAQERTRVPDAPCRAEGNTNRETICLLAAARKADRQLERMVRVLQKTLKPEEFKEFYTAQSRWYPFREANCAAERDLYTELSVASLAYVACAEANTRQRVEELKLMYAWLFR